MTDQNSSSFDALARSNVNSVWGALTMEVLARLGVETVVVSPGSRSTPLTIAAARNPKLEAISILDERSAGFFALGLAKRTRKPVALVCTSGSAVVNYHPAVLEASMSGTPLLVLTADRPAELRDCSSGQTIDQMKIFGDSVRAFYEMALPESTPALLAYLRQTLVHAVDRSLNGNAGPVHLNFPFRDPLLPEVNAVPVIEATALEAEATVSTRPCEMVGCGANFDTVALERLASHRQGVIVVGAVNPRDGDESFADAVAMLSHKLGWPVLSDVLNPLRGHAGQNQSLICHYDAFLRNPATAESCEPTAVLQIGPLPTSKVLRAWLAGSEAVAFLLSDRPINTDPLHRVATPLHGEAHVLAELLAHQSVDPDWIQSWVRLEQQAVATLDAKFEATDALFEGKVSWLLSQHLPVGTPTFIASSMSVRYAEFFWNADSRACPIFCNRGANGIDGTLGTALGVAHRGSPAVLLSGDLAFLHDSNALLAAGELKGSLTVVLVNNNGGGIFEHLPVAAMDADFEQYFATPQRVQIDQLCAAHGVAHQQVADWEQFVAAISSLPEQGVRVIEVPTDRKADVTTLRALIESV
ncbi:MULTISPECIES: 2-succinyl-5-enolpyruvyl-6-hydroxy-3-cyclohexene-1-carboxylic-acid synthase [unclassified Lentimonas]|uniref:2-succinyl-5-enolpyruvyl-6-hydroxy-3- cyclohexene-1-carboxylic-acid synthase n=1 Tax=unclassified Lentimonas TaxID=2630993 RepID=UPI001FD108DB|nr:MULTISPECIES: 2-succinyl-5-enolpyruvyl-6-hydroxy-3-cyclohexene-1-carboxylic-acid synthase [unclassified Lentimonas]